MGQVSRGAQRFGALAAGALLGFVLINGTLRAAADARSRRRLVDSNSQTAKPVPRSCFALKPGPQLCTGGPGLRAPGRCVGIKDADVLDAEDPARAPAPFVQ